MTIVKPQQKSKDKQVGYQRIKSEVKWSNNYSYGMTVVSESFQFYIIESYTGRQTL